MNTHVISGKTYLGVHALGGFIQLSSLRLEVDMSIGNHMGRERRCFHLGIACPDVQCPGQGRFVKVLVPALDSLLAVLALSIESPAGTPPQQNNTEG